MRRESESLNVCPRCAEPVVFTMEFPYAEWYCVVCEWKGGIATHGLREVTPELLERAAELAERYERERAERTGDTVRSPPQDVPRPTCDGCGKIAEGRLDHRGKPAHWYMRTKDGVPTFACSRACIPSEEPILPW